MKQKIVAIFVLASMLFLAACDTGGTSSTSNPAAPTATVATSSESNQAATPTTAAADTPSTAALADTPTAAAADNAAPAAATDTPAGDSSTSTDTLEASNTNMPTEATALRAVSVEVPSEYSDFQPGGKINLPAGFHISVYAAGLSKPRMMAIAPNGDLFVANMNAGQVVALRDRDSNGAADSVEVYANGLNGPHSLVFYNGYLYVACNDRVVRYQYNSGDLQANGGAQLVTDDVVDGGGHTTRTIAISSDGKRLFVAAGSSCNVCVETDERRAAISVFDLDANSGAATNRRIYASGLRNAVGITFAPGSNNLWAVVNNRDNLGDNVPPEILVQVKDGKNYGWPYCYGDRVYDRSFVGKSAAYCQSVELPNLKIQAHSAPLGLDFYTGSQFPKNYSGNLFIGYHGSWNRSVPTGVKVVRVPFVNGNPQPPIDFATGWLRGSDKWGRPVAPLTAPDGSLFVTDDAAGVVYRIYYTGK